MFVLFFTSGFVLQIVYIGKHLFKILFNHHNITLFYLFCETFWKKKLEFWFLKNDYRGTALGKWILYA